jgi:hypothetical protein
MGKESHRARISHRANYARLVAWCRFMGGFAAANVLLEAHRAYRRAQPRTRTDGTKRAGVQQYKENVYVRRQNQED